MLSDREIWEDLGDAPEFRAYSPVPFVEAYAGAVRAMDAFQNKTPVFISPPVNGWGLEEVKGIGHLPITRAQRQMKELMERFFMLHGVRLFFAMNHVAQECVQLREQLDATIADKVLLADKHTRLLEEKSQSDHQLAYLRQKLFGGGQSEQRHTQETNACTQENDTSVENIPQKVCGQVSPRPRNPVRKRVYRQESFEHLPTREVIEIIPDEVKAAPDLYERIGAERTFEVDFDPIKFYRREIVRYKYRLKHDRSAPPIIAPAPEKAIQGGYASAGLIAHVAVSKFLDHLPLHRIEKIFERHDVNIPRNTMCDWVGKCAELLEPVYKLMRRDILAASYIQVDETPVRYIDGGEKLGKTKKGWLWVLNDPYGDVAFGWHPSRGLAALQEQIGNGYSGLIQSDGYAAYEALARDGHDITRLGCWAHARRKFYEARDESPVIAAEFLDLIGELYEHERRCDDSDVAHEDRMRQRFENFPKIFDRLRTLAHDTATHVARPKSAIGKACSYLLTQWESLVAHMGHGHTRLDNNRVENAIRPSALGKGNWLFVGDKDAGDRAAILYSMVLSARRRNIEPWAYLKDLLIRLPRMTNKDDLSVLLPKNWGPAAI